MTRDAIADRLASYADAVVAFSVVNLLAFLVTLVLAEAEVRCSLARETSVVALGMSLFGVGMLGAVILLRRAEVRARASGSSTEREVERFLRGFFVLRLCVIALFTAFTIVAVVFALSLPGCPAAVA